MQLCLDLGKVKKADLKIVSWLHFWLYFSAQKHNHSVALSMYS